MQMALEWLKALRASAATLPQVGKVRPYWSLRQAGAKGLDDTSIEATAVLTAQAIHQMLRADYFAQDLGYGCVDDAYSDVDAAIEDQLERRLGKRDLWRRGADQWSRDDLFDVIEVFHDLASRPTRRYFHSYAGCGWHPTAFSRRSGQAIYRRSINAVLQESVINLRLADDGEDIGRLVRVDDTDLDALVDETLASRAGRVGEVAHAVALFRSREASREDMRSAIVALARVLERRRSEIKGHLTKADEGALLEIANKFDLRHSKSGQLSEYRVEFLTWIFYWYLATIQLTDRVLKQQSGSDEQS